MAKRTRSRTPRLWAIRIGVVAATFLMSVTVVANAAANAEEDKVRTAVRGALKAQQEVGLPPADLAAGRMSDRAKEAIAAAGEKRLREYFSGDQLKFAIQILADNIDEQSSGELRHQAAGVKNLVLTSVAIDEDIATVTATATVWARFTLLRESDGELQPAEPSNGMMFELTLNKIDGKWLVVQEKMRFAPGESP
jgi:hypothetical protein